MWLSQ
jgi:hypothetical protein